MLCIKLNTINVDDVFQLILIYHLWYKGWYQDALVNAYEPSLTTPMLCIKLNTINVDDVWALASLCVIGICVYNTLYRVRCVQGNYCKKYIDTVHQIIIGTPKTRHYLLHYQIVYLWILRYCNFNSHSFPLLKVNDMR